MYPILIAIFSSIIVFTLITCVYSIAFNNKVKIKKRIDDISLDRLPWSVVQKRKNSKKSFIDIPTFFNGKFLEKLSGELSAAAIPLRTEEFLIIWILITIVPSSFLALMGVNIITCLALLLSGAALPPILVKRAKSNRMMLFDKQLGEALTIIGNCLRAGFSFNQAMESIAQEMPDPIAKEFTKTLRDIKLGLTIESALQNMVKRLSNSDLELIISAVLIQRQVGGNLSEILDSISDTIKERLKIKVDIKVLTASGRTSGMIVGLLPVFILGILMIMNPSYVSMFFETKIGMLMLGFGVVLEIIGFICIKKVVDIKF